MVTFDVLLPLRCLEHRARASVKAALLAVVASFVLVAAGAAGAAEAAPPALILDTPRRTFDTFLDAARRGDWTSGAELLDLHQLREAERKKRGPELAEQLYAVLDRALWIDADTVPDETSLKAGVTSHRLAAVPLAGRDVAITLVNVTPTAKEARWLFSSSTVALVPSLFEQYGAGPIEARLPPSVTKPRFGRLALWQWVGLAVALPVALVLGRSLAYLVVLVATRLAKRTKARWDDALVVRLRGPGRLFFALVVFWGSTTLFTLPAAFERTVASGLKMAFLAVFGFAVIRAVTVASLDIEARARAASVGGAEGDASVTRALRARGIATQVRVMRRVINVTVGVVTLALISMQFEIVRSVGMSILASAGVLGVVLGLAAQRTIGSLIAGIQLSATQPVRIGDEVVVEKEWGVIEEITLTYVVVRVWDERRLVVPIVRFLEHPFENWTKVGPALHGTVFLFPDPKLPVDALRAELDRVIATEPLWDGRTKVVQVTDASEQAMTVRVLVSARNAGELFGLRAKVREHLLAWLASYEGGRYVSHVRNLVAEPEWSAASRGPAAALVSVPSRPRD